MQNSRMYWNSRAPLALLLAVCTLSGCTSYGTGLVQTVLSNIKPQPGGNAALLIPAYRYLRVSIKGRIIFVTLGDRDNHPDGPIEVYYSSGREVIRLQNGRIVGTVGLLTEWRNVSVREMPNWDAVARASGLVAGERVRDVMPGYRYGIRDKLVVNKIAPPIKTQLLDVDADSLTWFEERNENSAATGRVNWFFSPEASDETLPPARYAVEFAGDRETVVYGEQCLAPDLCFTWQRWTPKKL